MSVKQQNRQRALNREQFDKEAKPAKLSDALQNRIDALQRNLAAERAELATARELIATLQHSREALQAELTEQTSRAECWHKTACATFRANQDISRNWRKTSAMLRMLTPEKVDELRQAVEET